MKIRLLPAALALLLASPLATLAATQAEVAECRANAASVDPAACIKEVDAAKAAGRRGQLTPERKDMPVRSTAPLLSEKVPAGTMVQRPARAPAAPASR